ncbi:MAG: LysR family transcriptional regulator [Veillonellaceae bacterium]|nr:LysR family transcriptional regulator [Veillonellaceae bacterium]
MDLDYFRNFIMMVDSQTLTEAAKRLSMVQPALSAQLKQIEKIYGAELIITQRGGRRIELTEAGELFYRRAQDIVAIADELRHEVTTISHGGMGTLRAAITPGAVNGFIDDYLRPFRETTPEFRVVFNESSADRQAESLLAGTVDIGVMNEPIARGYLFERLSIRYRSLAAVVAAESDYFPEMYGKLRIEDLAGKPLCVTRSLAGRLEDFFRDRGLQDDIRSVCTTNALALHWARRGMGVAVIMGEPDEADASHLRTLPIAPEDMLGAEHIYKVKDRKLSTVAQKFCAFISERI